MKRPLFALLPALLAGCLAGPHSRVGQPPEGRDCQLVERALGAVTIPSFERHIRGDGWTMRHCGLGMSGTHQMTEWRAQFACQPSGVAPGGGTVFPLPPEEYERILTPIRADVLAAVEKTGVEITEASEVTSDGGAPEARFVICYLRKGGEVAGEVVGRLAPVNAKDPDRRFSDLTVTLREWYCR
jgi:hypothetical protein